MDYVTKIDKRYLYMTQNVAITSFHFSTNEIVLLLYSIALV